MRDTTRRRAAALILAIVALAAPVGADESTEAALETELGDRARKWVAMREPTAADLERAASEARARKRTKQWRRAYWLAVGMDAASSYYGLSNYHGAEGNPVYRVVGADDALQVAVTRLAIGWAYWRIVERWPQPHRRAFYRRGAYTFAAGTAWNVGQMARAGR